MYDHLLCVSNRIAGGGTASQIPAYIFPADRRKL
jgi:hypothetical protein